MRGRGFFSHAISFRYPAQEPWIGWWSHPTISILNLLHVSLKPPKAGFYWPLGEIRLLWSQWEDIGTYKRMSVSLFPRPISSKNFFKTNHAHPRCLVLRYFRSIRPRSGCLTSSEYSAMPHYLRAAILSHRRNAMWVRWPSQQYYDLCARELLFFRCNPRWPDCITNLWTFIPLLNCHL